MKNLLFFLLFPIFLTSQTTSIIENFDDQNASPLVLTGSYIDPSNFCSGLYSAAFNGNGDLMTTPEITPTSSSTLSFNYKRSSNSDAWSMVIEISTNGGSIWSTLQTISSATTTCANVNISLSPYSSFQDVLIRWRDTRASGGAERYIDDVTILDILPVEILFFESKISDNSIHLLWSTATEQNNDYIAIERSFDAENFSEIGRVKGAGSSLERIDYSFVDRFPYQGTNYYRLRQVDYDGTTTFHKVIAVEFTGESVNTLGFVPMAEGIQVQFRAPGAGGEIILVDATGRMLHAQKFDGQTLNTLVNTASLPRGFYVVQVRRADGKLEAWPLIK